jgi:integrase
MLGIVPLKKTEQEKLLQAAKNVPDYFGINVYETVAFFLDTGIHPSVLANKEARKLRLVEEDGRKHIEWYRPKKKGMAAYTRLSVSKRLAPFVQRYLSQPLPNYRQFYNNLLNEVKKVLRKAYPHEDWVDKVCPLSLRHSFAINRLSEGHNVIEVQQLMNCSRKTLEYYTKYRPDMLSEKTW